MHLCLNSVRCISNFRLQTIQCLQSNMGKKTLGVPTWGNFLLFNLFLIGQVSVNMAS